MPIQYREEYSSPKISVLIIYAIKEATLSCLRSIKSRWPVDLDQLFLNEQVFLNRKIRDSSGPAQPTLITSLTYDSTKITLTLQECFYELTNLLLRLP